MTDAELHKRTTAFINHMLEYTLRLVRLDDVSKEPRGIASGFMIPVAGKLRVISAGHALGALGHWVVEATQASATETLCFTVMDIRVADKLVRLPTGEQIDIDLAWGDLDPAVLSKQLAAGDSTHLMPINTPTYVGPVGDGPSQHEAYGFASWSRVCLIEDRAALIREAAYEVYMEYAGRDSSTDLCIFKLSREHQGHDYYRGASGAPIADATGKIVSLVVGGSITESVVYGAPLCEYSSILTSALP